MIEYIERLLQGAEVEWKTLGEVAEFYNGLTGKNTHDFETGNARYVPYKNIFDNIEINECLLDCVTIGANEKQNSIQYGDILFTGSSETPDEVGMSCAVTKHFAEPIYLNSFSFGIRFHQDIQIIPEFAKYIFRCTFVRKQIIKTANGVTRFNVSKVKFKRISIPIPPLGVQEEIVRILDKFTMLEAELEERLEAELECRSKQYGYYKGQMFDSLSCPTKHITDIAIVKARVGWQRLTTSEYMHTGDYFLVTGTDFKNGYIDFNNCVYVSKERYEMDPNIIVGKGDILITKDGTLGKVAFVTESPDKPTTLNSGIFRIHVTDKDILPRYLFHYFTSKYFTDFVESVKTGSTIPHLTQQGLTSLNIPIPSIEEQLRIVRILDKFDTLTTSISEGLPREIELRRKQYEYYREQLLNFTRN